MKPSLWHLLKSSLLLAALIALCQIVIVSAAPPLQAPDPLTELQAVSAEPPTITYSDQTRAANFFSGAIPTSGGNADARSRGFLTRYGSLFGVRDARAELSVLRSESDSVGMEHITYEQHYRGVPVFGARLVVHLDRDGRVTAANGDFQPGIALNDVKPVIGGDAAQTAAQRSIGADAIEWQRAPRLVIWTHNEGGAAARLAWEVLGLSDNPLGRWQVFVDARSGEIAYQLNIMDTVKNRTVYTAGNGTSLPGTFICNESNPVPCNSDSAAQNAFNFSGTTYDYYKNNFNRDSYNNAGAGLNSTVHYSFQYNNAFWNGSQMVYGDGDGVTYGSFANSLDVVAHELTHAVTEYTSGLFYEYESGALNESYSDVFGVFVEGNTSDWIVGEDLYLSPTTYGIRSLADPTKGGQWDPNDPYPTDGSQPDHMTVKALLPSRLDNGGVHINSGIPNKAAYLITNGGTFHGITTAGIGFAKAGQIFYRTQTMYNTVFTNFGSAAYNTYRACRDLIGQFSITMGNCNSVLNGFAAVGLGPSAALTTKLYLPLVLNNVPDPNPGIYGRVTNNGAAAGGIALRIFRCPAGSTSCVDFGGTTTDGNGNYRFTGQPTLPSGFAYDVIYNQGGSDCTRWTQWSGTDILPYTAGTSAFGGDFDIRTPVLNSPSGNVAGGTQNFSWNLRTLPAGMVQDSPQMYILNSTGTSQLYNSGVMPRGTTSKSVGTFSNGVTYRWRIYEYTPYGLGFPLTSCDKVFTRTSLSGLPDLNPNVTPAAIQPGGDIAPPPQPKVAN